MDGKKNKGLGFIGISSWVGTWAYPFAMLAPGKRRSAPRVGKARYLAFPIFPSLRDEEIDVMWARAPHHFAA